MRRLRGMTILSLFVSFIFAFLVFGCAKPPKQELETAEKALSDAKAKEAHIYAEETYKKAEEALSKAQSLVNEKKYKEAKKLAQEAEKLARQAETEIESGKARMKEETEKLLSDIRTSIEETKKMIPEVVKKKIISREEARTLLSKWESELSSAKENFDKGNLKDARDKAKALMDEINEKVKEMKK
ncbi:MAG: DUF4398 domain-containing protein [Desulfobacterota bacterium]|nr:DUF4398 domain-containing protein [Thermodesulfobacteriota bacterium]MDW8001717.1 DUF4398 domain-containing protein [Deltaproteobacteria bacterium]